MNGSLPGHPPSSAGPQMSFENASPQSTTSFHSSSPGLMTHRSLKRKRSHFSMRPELMLHPKDFISEGLVTENQALSFWDCFFAGCDRFVPFFDAADNFLSIRMQSNLLLNAILAVGCAVSGDFSVDCRILQAYLKRWLTVVILSQSNSLETVQALLVSPYSPSLRM